MRSGVPLALLAIACTGASLSWLTSDRGAVRQPGGIPEGALVSLEDARSRLTTTVSSHSVEPETVSIPALVAAEEYDQAFASVRAAAPDLREDWLRLVFQRWGASHPAEAVHAASTLTDEALHAVAFRALIDSWMESHPKAAASFAVRLPAGPDRDYAVRTAIEKWGLIDPAEMAGWVGLLREGAEFDRAATWLVTHTDNANRPTAVAMEWAEAIQDPEQRFVAIRHAAKEWARQAPADARNYVESASGLAADKRAEILRDFAAGGN